MSFSRTKMTGAIHFRSRVVRAVRRVRAISRRNYVEELAARSDAGLATLIQRRRWLLPVFIFGLVTTALVWIAALRFPHAASSVLWNGFDTNSKLVTICSCRFLLRLRSFRCLRWATYCFPSRPELKLRWASCRLLSTGKNPTGNGSSLLSRRCLAL